MGTGGDLWCAKSTNLFDLLEAKIVRLELVGKTAGLGVSCGANTYTSSEITVRGTVDSRGLSPKYAPNLYIGWRDVTAGLKVECTKLK